MTSLRALAPLRSAVPARRIAVSARRIAALGLVALLAAGCMPASTTSQGQAINGLYVLFFGAAAVVFAIVAGLITWSIFRYRRTSPPPGDVLDLPPQVRDNRLLETIWTGLPILTVIGLFAATMVTLGVVQARAPQDSLNMRVTAFQWSWQFEYPDAGVVITGTPGQTVHMVVPVGRTVHITLVSADVNHAFYVPAFLFKMDAIPGRVGEFNFKVDQAGTYRGQCAEFCGIYHDRMIFEVDAVSPAQFQTWLSQQPHGTLPPSPTSVVAQSPTPAPSSR